VWGVGFLFGLVWGVDDATADLSSLLL